MAKIFVSYKRNVEPDTLVATAVYEALREEHDVFIDRTIKVGEKWADEIQKAIREADYLIAFLSKYSVRSEMVVGEIESAHHHGKEHGTPKILPVSLDFNENLVYPLSAYLNPLQWALWRSDTDTSKLIAELLEAISGNELPSTSPKTESLPSSKEAPPAASANIPIRDFGFPEGTMEASSSFYVERKADQEANDFVQRGGTIIIKGPHQIGKSSLLHRIMLHSQLNGIRNAFVDFRLIENSTMQNAEIFYKQFCSLLSWELDVDDRTKEFWASPLGHMQKTTNYVQSHLLKQIQDTNILLALDTIERMFASPFRSDFFSMLRSWHNRRVLSMDWERLNLALATSLEPYQFIDNLNQSPFTVGTILDLSDFSLEEVAELESRYGNLLSENELEKLFRMFSGHPYLTGKALYFIANKKISFKELESAAYEDDGPFSDHLRNYLFRLSEQSELKSAFLQVLKHQRCADEKLFSRLRGEGLIRRVEDKIMPRNTLYEEYFSRHLNG